MIEIIVKNHLDSQLEEQIFLEKPRHDFGSYVLIERVGGLKKNHLPSAIIAVQSYAESMFKAAALNEKVKGAMESAVQLDEIRGIKLDSDYNFTDTTTKRYRYQAIFDVKYY